MRAAPLLLLVCGIAAVGFVPACAYTERIDVTVDANYILSLRVFMRAAGVKKKDAAYIKVKIDATDADKSKETRGESRIGIMIMKEKRRPALVGMKTLGGQTLYCCSDPSTKTCGWKGEMDQVIVPEKPQQDDDFFRASFLAAKAGAVEEVAHVTGTALYSVLFTTCNHSKIVLRGEIITRDGSGFLPGYLAMRLPFYVWTTVAYVVLGVVWGLLCLRFRQEITAVQHYITLVLLMGMLTSIVPSIDYSSWNTSNVRSTFLLYTHVVLGSLTITFGYALLILVCWGYGVVRQEMGLMKFKLAFFVVAFFLSNTAKDIYRQASIKSSVEDASKDNNDAGSSVAFILFPAAVMNAIAMLWTYGSLTETVETLEKENQTVKLKHFTTFRFAMAGAFTTVVLWAVVLMGVESIGEIKTNYEMAWVFDVGPDALYMLIFSAVMVIWRPTQNSSRYGYYRQANSGMNADDFNDELSDEDEEYGTSLGMDEDEDHAENNGVQMTNIAARSVLDETIDIVQADSREVDFTIDDDEC